MPLSWKENHGSASKSKGGGNFPDSYFEGIFEAKVTGYKFEKLMGSNYQKVPANEVDPYNDNHRLLLEITVGDSKFPNRLSLRGGTPLGSVHRWADAMAQCGLNPETDDMANIVGKPCKVLIYARIPVAGTGKIYTDVWKIFPVEMSDEVIRDRLRFSLDQGSKLSFSINENSMFFTGKPFLKDNSGQEVTVDVKQESSGNDSDDLPF